MESKEFGRIHRKVSAIGMGTYYDPLWIVTAFLGWKRGVREKVDAIISGLDAGMTLIDTAEIYGSETLVAKALRERRRDELFLATKVWPSHLRRESLFKALKRSLNRLQVDYVDLYQVHWPNPRIPMAETMGAMEELVNQGKVTGIGVSNFSLEELVEAREAMKKQEIASVQVDYSLTNRRIEEDVMPYCDREGIAVLAYYPLAHGKLVSKGKKIAGLCEKHSKTPAQVALNWLASKPNVFPIPRASRVSHVIEDVGASGWRLPDEDIRELERLFPA